MKTMKLFRWSFFFGLLLFFGSCITVNPTYSKLSEKEKASIHVVPFDSLISTPVAPTSAADILVKDINFDQLKGELDKSSKKLKWVMIYTAMCSGTPHILPYAKEVKEKYGKDVDLFLLASDDYATTNTLKKKLYFYGINFQTYIINNSYGEFKDNRQKGFIIRNLLCQSCTNDLIGVPYNLVFNQKNEIVFTKYRSYKTVGDSLVGSDFIGELLNKQE